jgi:hypothetical protein
MIKNVTAADLPLSGEDRGAAVFKDVAQAKTLG